MANSLTEQLKELKQVVEGLEVKVLEWALEKGRGVLKGILEGIDQLLFLKRGRDLSSEHIRGVTYTTVLGDIRVWRRQYLDKATGKYRYLLDELLGMEKRKHNSIEVKRQALQLSAQESFRASAEILKELTPIQVSHQTIWNLLKEVAEPHLEERDREIEHFLETGELPQGEGKKVSHLMIEGDGVMIPLQRERARKAEIKVGIAYEGWEVIGRDRYKTANKTIYADVNGSEAYWAGMMLELYRKYDVGAARRVIVGGDGAAWVKEGADWIGGVFQLDRYHLHRELHCALGWDGKTVCLVSAACERGDIQSACQLLMQAEKKVRGEQAKKIARVRHYLRGNESGLKDYRLDLGEEGERLRRTGAMEGNGDKLVVGRMKGRGMSWSIKGCRRMLWVRFHFLAGSLKEVLHRGVGKARTSIPVGGKGLPSTRCGVSRIMDQALRQDTGDWLAAALPALYGPHQNRPWALALKSMIQGAI